VPSANVSVSGKRMGNKYGIGALCVEFSCHLITDIYVFETAAAIKLKRFRELIIPRLNDKGFVWLLFDFDTS
jgi:hypothetical protein